MSNSHFFLFIVLLLFNVGFLSGQNVKKLENERKATLKRMETTNKLLNETKKSQKSSVNKLNILNNNIKERKALINTINQEIVEIDKEVQTLNSQIKESEKKLLALKEDYAHLVKESYLNQNSQNKLLFVLSGENFNQVYRRLRYLQEYSAYRKEQVAEIEKLRAEIVDKHAEIKRYRSTKIVVLKEKQTETKNLSLNQQAEQKMLNDLKKKEKNLKTQLKKDQEKARRLNKRIETAVAQEVKKRQEKSKKAAAKPKPQPKPKPGEKPSATPEPAPELVSKADKLINGNFEKNKGRMPWPVERGVIIGRYGVHKHPVLKYVTVNNKGIYIQAPKGSEARAVFDGEVVERFTAQGSNNAVIVRHGTYLTVYANLTDIFVSKGDKVKAKQKIGKIYVDDDNDNKTELYFQLWKEKTLLNPQEWIVK